MTKRIIDISSESVEEMMASAARMMAEAVMLLDGETVQMGCFAFRMNLAGWWEMEGQVEHYRTYCSHMDPMAYFERYAN